MDAVIAAAVNGLGLSVMAKATVHEQLNSSKLVALLPYYEIDSVAIYAIPHREHLPAKVRVFMNFLQKYCTNASWSISS